MSQGSPVLGLLGGRCKGRKIRRMSMALVPSDALWEPGDAEVPAAEEV
jgi:hypothetical protein